MDNYVKRDYESTSKETKRNLQVKEQIILIGRAAGLPLAVGR
jgi:hypothetical protein